MRNTGGIRTGDRPVRRGRPQGRSETVVVVTRAPVEIVDYLRVVAASFYRRQSTMYRTLIREFLAERPWEQGMPWARPHSAGEDGRGIRWVQANVSIDRELAESMTGVCEGHGISRSALALTAMMWIVRAVHPPGGKKRAPDRES